jgi:hypothetical protein
MTIQNHPGRQSLSFNKLIIDRIIFSLISNHITMLYPHIHITMSNQKLLSQSQTGSIVMLSECGTARFASPRPVPTGRFHPLSHSLLFIPLELTVMYLAPGHAAIGPHCDRFENI